MSSPVTALGIAPGAGTPAPARHFSEPYRQAGALALLTGNALLLFLGMSRLLFVIDGWADGFGARSEAQFAAFAGPLALGMPMVAVLVATHVAPMVPRSRAILVTALVEYAVGALFGLITFLGAFAHDLFSVRATLEGLLERAVWLGLLLLAMLVVIRVLSGLYPPALPRGYATYSGPVYGRPYPGQPVYPQPTYPPATAGTVPGTPDPGVAAFGAASGTPVPGLVPGYVPGYPAAAGPVTGVARPDPGLQPHQDALFDEPTSRIVWPASPTQPGPAVIEFEPTIRVSPLTAPVNGEATQLMRPPPTGGDATTPAETGASATPSGTAVTPGESPTGDVDAPRPDSGSAGEPDR